MPFKATAVEALGGCWGEVGEVRLWVQLSVWSCARGVSVLGQNSGTELLWLGFGARHSVQTWGRCWGVAGVVWVKCQGWWGRPFKRSQWEVGHGQKNQKPSRNGSVLVHLGLHLVTGGGGGVCVVTGTPCCGNLGGGDMGVSSHGGRMWSYLPAPAAILSPPYSFLT